MAQAYQCRRFGVEPRPHVNLSNKALAHAALLKLARTASPQEKRSLEMFFRDPDVVIRAVSIANGLSRPVFASLKRLFSEKEKVMFTALGIFFRLRRVQMQAALAVIESGVRKAQKTSKKISQQEAMSIEAAVKKLTGSQCEMSSSLSLAFLRERAESPSLRSLNQALEKCLARINDTGKEYEIKCFLEDQEAAIFMAQLLRSIHNYSINSLLKILENREFIAALESSKDFSGLRETGRAFRIIKHMFSQPLNIIGRLMPQEGSFEENLQLAAAELSQQVYNAVSKMRMLLQYVDEYSSERKERRTCRVSGLLEQEKKSWDVMIPRLNIVLPRTDALITLVGKDLSFALFNILLNSYENNATEIVIEAEQLASGDVQIVINDNGNGFDPELTRKITEPGYTSRPLSSQYQGTLDNSSGHGHGTTVAKEIMGEHGGSFEISSEGKGKGAMVTLTFPKPS